MNIAFFFEMQVVFRKEDVLQGSQQGGAGELKQENANFLTFQNSQRQRGADELK